MNCKHTILLSNGITHYHTGGLQSGYDTIVIFLHGRERNSGDRDYQNTYHGPTTRFWALDLPGFGSSDAPSSVWSIQDYAQHFDEFCHKVGIVEHKDKNPTHPIILVGHSFGCRVALWFASHYPNIADRLVLFAPGGIQKPASSRLRQGIQYTSSLIRKLGGNSIITMIQNIIGSDDYRASTGIMRKILVQTVNTDLSPIMGSITCPVTIHRGYNDTAIPERHIDIMQRRITHVTVIKYPDYDHDIHYHISYLSTIT